MSGHPLSESNAIVVDWERDARSHDGKSTPEWEELDSIMQKPYLAYTEEYRDKATRMGMLAQLLPHFTGETLWKMVNDGFYWKECTLHHIVIFLKEPKEDSQ